MNSPIDNAINGLLGLGSTMIFSTIDLMGLCVFRAMLEALTFQCSRKLGTDILSLLKKCLLEALARYFILPVNNLSRRICVFKGMFGSLDSQVLMFTIENRRFS